MCDCILEERLDHRLPRRAIGPFAHRGERLIDSGFAIAHARPPLESALGRPAELHEDAPEFAVQAPIREAGREAVATTVSRILARKSLQPTRAAVSVVHAFVGSPYAAAEALAQLAETERHREIRADELRYALGWLEGVALFPEAPLTVGKVVGALLRAERRLSQTTLAKRADVSPRSIRRHQDVLEALDLVEVDAGDGWRLMLSFRAAEERRGEGVLPAPVATGSTLVEVVSDVAVALLLPEEYADPRGEVYVRLSWPAEPWALLEDPRLDGWIGVAAALVGESRPTEPTMASMGPRLEQVPLPSAPGTVDASSI